MLKSMAPAWPGKAGVCKGSPVEQLRGAQCLQEAGNERALQPGEPAPGAAHPSQSKASAAPGLVAGG